MTTSEKNHLDKLLKIYYRRLQVLETQVAQYGIDAPAHIVLEIEDIKEKIQEIEQSQGKETTPEVSVSSSKTTEGYTLSNQQILELVDLLLQTHTMRDNQSREVVIDQLPPRIKNSIVRNPASKVDLFNIVKAVLSYDDGLENLLSALRFFEDGSIPMRKIDSFAAEFKK